MLRRTLLAGLAVLGLAVTAQAGPVYLAMVVDPATTAGAGIPTVSPPRSLPPATFSVSSNKNGAGSWHLYALDDSTGSFGIAFFSIALNGTVSNVFNRSPNASFDTLDGNGDSTGQSGATGFSDALLRSGTPNPATPVQGAQGIGSLFRIGGFGQTASNFNNTPNVPVPPAGGSRSWAGITSGNWGDYATDPDTTTQPQLNLGNKKFILLGEGNYTGAKPTVNAGASSTVLFYSASSFDAQGQATLALWPDVPEPASIALLGLAVVGGLGFRRRSA